RMGFASRRPRPRSTERSIAWSGAVGPEATARSTIAVADRPAPLPDRPAEGAIDGAAGARGAARRVAGRMAGLILRTVGRRLVDAPPPAVPTPRVAFPTRPA